MAPIRKAFNWELLPQPSETVCRSNRFPVPSDAGRSNELWQLQLTINPNPMSGHTIQFALNKGGAIEIVPKSIQNSRIEVSCYGIEPLVIPGCDHKISKSKEFITFPTQKATIATLTNQYRNPIKVQFIYDLELTPDAPRNENQLLMKPFTFYWTPKDTEMNAMFKVWPPFQIRLATAKITDAQLSCCTNNNRMQFRLQTSSIQVEEFARYFADSSIQFTYSPNKSCRFDEVTFRVVPKENVIYLKTLGITLSELSMGFVKSFQVDVTFHPIGSTKKSSSDNVATATSLPVKQCSITPKANQVDYRLENDFATMAMSDNKTTSKPATSDIKAAPEPKTDIKATSKTLTGMKASSDPPTNTKASSNTPTDSATINFIFHPELFPINTQTSPVLRDLNDLLSKQESCNIVFTCRGGIHIGAHQHILEMRCPGFDDFLANIPSMDIDAEALIDALQYIYTGCAPNLAKTAERLLPIAEHFGMAELKEVAENALIESMQLHQDIEKLQMLIDRFHEESVQPKILEFVQENIQHLLEQPWFGEVLKNRPDVWYEVFKGLCS